MKRIRVEDGKRIAYITQSDVVALIELKELVPKSIFMEETILSGTPNRDGYYRVEDVKSVGYIVTSNFIPNEDYHENLSANELKEKAEQAACNHNALVEVLKKLYSRYKLDEHDRNVLESNSAIRQANAQEVQQEAYIRDDIERESRFIALEEGLIIQSKHYADSISELACRKMTLEAENKESSEGRRVFSLKRLFRRR